MQWEGRGSESTKVHEVEAQEIGSWPADQGEPWEHVCVLNHTSQLVPSWPTRPSISLRSAWLGHVPATSLGLGGAGGEGNV